MTQSPAAGRLPACPLTRTAMLVIAFAGLGGFLYGFDIGVISGALAFMERDIGFGASESGLIVGAVLFGGAFATFFSGSMADRFGRRWSINMSSIVYIVGTVLVMIAGSFHMILAGRLIEGLGVGIITIVVPLYLAETLPARQRGRGIALFQLCLTFGILIGYVVNYALKGTGDWRFMFGTSLLPAAVFLAGGLFALPRSPRWLFVKGHEDEARHVLGKTQGEASVDASLAEMKAVIAEEASRGKGSWAQLFRPGYRKAFLIALGVGIFTQLTGINVLLQFATPLLNASGLHVAILGSIGIGLVNFVVTFIALSLVDKLGRRPLLIFGTAGIVVSTAFVGVVQLLFPGTPFAGYGTLAGMMAFVVSYAVGPGVVVWLAISEVMPLAIRAKGMSVALCANSLTSALLGSVFIYIVDAVGYSGLFFLFALCTVFYLLIAIFPLPETKGRSLEEIEEELFKGIRAR
ncbi:MAG TPA: sugar porter family MFS transporter [Rhodanobacteraceae bacterium]